MTDAFLLVLGFALCFVCAYLAWVAHVRKRSGRRHSNLPVWLSLAAACLVAWWAAGNELSWWFSRMALLTGAAWLALVFLLRRRDRAKPAGVKGPLVLLGLGLLALVTYREPRVHLLVQLGPDDDIGELSALLDRFDADHERAFPNVTLDEDEDLAQYFLVGVPVEDEKQVWLELRNELREDVENVDSADINYLVRAVPILEGNRGAMGCAKQVADDPLAEKQWGFAAAKGCAALKLLASLPDDVPRAPAIVAIADTGVDASHDDLADAFGRSPADDDSRGHGTHCAGTAGSPANNATGIASLNWEGRFVEVRGYRALPDDGIGTVESIAQAIIDAAEDGADVISLSLGGVHETPPPAEVDAIEYALRLGSIVVASAGNEGRDAAEQSPANIDGVIVVSAVGKNLRRAQFSNTTVGIDRGIAAPGVDILSLSPGDEYAALSGTSMATPMVAGLIGVMRALNPELTADDVWRILRETAQPSPDAATAGPLVDMEAALLRARRFQRR